MVGTITVAVGQSNIDNTVLNMFGWSENVGMVPALGAKLGAPLNVAPDSQFTGALGAALFALDHVLAAQAMRRPVAAEPAVWVDG